MSTQEGPNNGHVQGVQNDSGWEDGGNARMDALQAVSWHRESHRNPQEASNYLRWRDGFGFVVVVLPHYTT